jgi:CspA family cold shock protein
MKGTVKWYDYMKGYGFIHGEDGKDVFVHRSSVPFGAYLYAEDQVEYDIDTTDKGPKAINIKKLKKHIDPLI